MSARRIGPWIAAVLALLAGCTRLEPPKAFEIGPHRGEIRPPPGWAVIDQGGQWRMREGEIEIVLQDLGSVEPRGIRREAAQALELWRSGQAEQAQWRLSKVSMPRELFPQSAERDAVWAAQSALTDPAAREWSLDQVEAAFAELLVAVDALPRPDLQAIADAGLAALGHDQRRDVKSRTPVKIGMHQALAVETWNRLSHASPQRYLFVANDGYLLALYTARQADVSTLLVYDVVRASLQLAPPGAAEIARR